VPSGVATGTPEERQKAAEKTLSESAYLQLQANQAKAAIGAALDDLKKGLATGVNPAGWAKQYPWIAVGAGAVAGFMATSLLVPSKEEQALAKLAKIERALNPPPPPPPQQAAANGAPSGEQQYKSGQSSLVRAVLGEVVSAIKPAVISLLTAGTTAAVAKTSPEEMAAANAKQQPPPTGGTAQ
jgi:hypothetical protein